MGDDWFHNGAFREHNLPYIYEQIAHTRSDSMWLDEPYDDYDESCEAGSAGEFGRRCGMDQLASGRSSSQHPAYDAFWQRPGNGPVSWRSR